MDKYEYRVKTEQMMEHMEKKQYKRAMEIADTIDWRRVKNAAMLNTVSEIYEFNGEFQKSRDILFVAFDRAPSSRKIVYRLGILALKIEDTEEASDCYEEFVKLAPKDPNQYILKYKILKAQGSPLSEQISALSEFKKAEYVEKWAYELAKLYHEAGMTAECLEECDDLILWFSEGKYVYQAMELKMQYKPLTPLQQEKYDSYGGKKNAKIRKPQSSARPIPKKEDMSAQRPMVKSVPTTTAVFSELPEEVLSSQEEHPEESEEKTQADETRKFPTGELTKALAAMEAENKSIQKEDTGKSVYAETEETELDRTKEKKRTPITTVVKGATLEEALANGVAMANGINREEKKRMEQREEEIRISGQMKIEDILQEWEEKQKVNAEAIEEQRAKDEERLRKEREELETRREAERREAERREAERREAEEVARHKAEAEARKEEERKAAEEAAKKEAERRAAEEAARKEAERKEAEEKARKEEEHRAAEEAAKKKTARKVKKAPVLSDDIRQLVEELEGKVAEEESLETDEKEESEDNYQMELDFLMAEDEESEADSDEDVFGDAIGELDFGSGDGFDDGGFDELNEESEEDFDEEDDEKPDEEIGEGDDEEISEDSEEEDFADEGYEESDKNLEEEDDRESEEEELEEDFEEEDIEEEELEEDFEEEDFEEEELEEDFEEEDFEEEELEKDFEEEDFEEEELEEDFEEEDFEEEELEEGFEEEDFEEEELEEDFEEEDFEEEELEEDFEEDFDETDFEEDFEEEGFSEEDFEEDFEEEGFEEEELEEDFEEDEFEEEDFFEEDELPQVKGAEKEAPLEIEEPSEEEIQKRIKKSKGSGVPFDTGFVVTGRYDLSATSEIGLKAGLTEEQKKLFSYFVPVRGMSEQIVEALDNDRRAQREGTSKTGNLLVIGRKGSGKTVLAVDIVKAIQKQRNLKQGKVAIVTGESLNKKELSNIIQKLRGGAIIIEKAGKLNSRTIKELSLLMEKKTGEMLFVLEDQRKPLERILTAHPDFKKKFTSRLELPVFINDELVTFGQTYAKENGYKLDEMGILALYSRIDVMQREDHAVTVAEVKDIMDEAIAHSQKANVKHLARRMFGKSTDSSDRIILKEEDFKI